MKMNKRLAGLLNTPAQRWSPLLLRLQAYWRQLAPRERKILAGGGLALCLALTWQVFVDPPLARIEAISFPPCPASLACTGRGAGRAAGRGV